MFSELEIKEIIDWAIKKPDKKEIAKWQNNKIKKFNKLEKEWGNKMIKNILKGKKTNQWTTKLGELVVFSILYKLGYNPKIPEKKKNYKPDIETDKYIYEVKTRNWTTSGTAGEKVYGVPYKYASIPKLYGKPLKIICIGYQEYELTYGNTPVFNLDIEKDKEHYDLIEYYKTKNIEFIKFSDLASEYMLAEKMKKLNL